VPRNRHIDHTPAGWASVRVERDADLYVIGIKKAVQKITDLCNIPLTKILVWSTDDCSVISNTDADGAPIGVSHGHDLLDEHKSTPRVSRIKTLLVLNVSSLRHKATPSVLVHAIDGQR
jgi:hypothetical protein